jgi:hypothetical protein
MRGRASWPNNLSKVTVSVIILGVRVLAYEFVGEETQTFRPQHCSFTDGEHKVQRIL